MRPLLVCSLIAASLSACALSTQDSGHQDSPFRNTGINVDYVGDAACVDCHESEWQGFQSHGMSQSFYPMAADRVVEDFAAEPVYHDGSDFYYRPFADEGEFFQEEFRLNEEGDKVFSLIRRIDFVIGSGNAARTYLSKSNNRLYELPLSWFSQGQGWALSPGFSRENGRFNRLMTDRCMACHNSYPTPVTHVAGKFLDVPGGIGCERCHGPASLHVAERLEDPATPDSIDTSIVNPAHLSLERELDVCQQCHVTGAVTVFREGHSAFGFRPGLALSAHVTIYEERNSTPGSSISVVSHADRLKMSACFRETIETGRPISCVTCHDPHQGFRDQEPSYFNDTCLTCHTDIADRFPDEPQASNHTANSNCFSCHMPRVVASNVPHASFTDHWIRSVPDSVTSTDTPLPQDVELSLLLGEETEQNDSLRDLGMAYLINGEQKAGESSISRGLELLDESLAIDPDHGEAQFLYGRALVNAGQFDDAILALERANELDGPVPERMQELGWAYEMAGKPALMAETLYRDALQIQPQFAEIRVRLAQLLEAEGRFESALAEFQEAATEQPWLESAHYGAGTVSLSMQKLDDAERSFENVLALNPDFTNALANLGAVKIMKGDLEAAVELFSRAIEIEPTNVAALGNLGLTYAQLGNYQEARNLLQRVLILSPQDQRARAAFDEVRRLMQ